MVLSIPDDVVERAYTPGKRETKKVYVLVALQRRLSLPLSYFVFVPLGVSPNLLTILSMLVGLGGAYLLATGWVASGAMVLIVWGLLDCCDGEVARLTGRLSPAGALLETLNSNVQYVLWLPALCYGLYTEGQLGVQWVFAAFLFSGLFNTVRGFYGNYPVKFLGPPAGPLKTFLGCQFKDMFSLRQNHRVPAFVFYGWRNVIAQHGLFELVVLVSALAFPAALTGVAIFYVFVYALFSVTTIVALVVVAPLYGG
jgi:phosphatidylglycerophosphate synthase